MHLPRISQCSSGRRDRAHASIPPVLAPPSLALTLTRYETNAIIAGAILPLWNALDKLTVVLEGRGPKYMRCTRVRLSNGQRVVGVKVRCTRVSLSIGSLSKEEHPLPTAFYTVARMAP